MLMSLNDLQRWIWVEALRGSITCPPPPLTIEHVIFIENYGVEYLTNKQTASSMGIMSP